MKSVYIDLTQDQYPCDEAELDTQRLLNLVKMCCNESFRLTDNLSQADLIIIHCCGHLESKEAAAVNAIRRVSLMRKASSEIIVWGCLPKINPALLSKVYKGPIVGPEDFNFFCDLFSIQKDRIRDIHANTLKIPSKLIVSSMLPKKRSGDTLTSILNAFTITFKERKHVANRTWYIKIVSGCKNHCTYCSDKLAYGFVRSEPVETIIDQFRIGIERGYRQFYLVGRDLGSYGYDIGLSLPDLLKEIVSEFPCQDYKFALTNLSPNTLIDMYQQLRPLLSLGKISEIGSHIQSGSNRILKLMGKSFNMNNWIEIMKDIGNQYPEIDLDTSIMTGFPTETDRDFEKSIDLLNEIEFDDIAVYNYNERPGIPSLKLKGRVAEEIKTERYHRLSHVAAICQVRKRIKRGHVFPASNFVELLEASYHFAILKKMSLSRQLSRTRSNA